MRKSFRSLSPQSKPETLCSSGLKGTISKSDRETAPLEAGAISSYSRRTYSLGQRAPANDNDPKKLAHCTASPLGNCRRPCSSELGLVQLAVPYTCSYRYCSIARYANNYDSSTLIATYAESIACQSRFARLWPALRLTCVRPLLALKQGLHVVFRNAQDGFQRLVKLRNWLLVFHRQIATMLELGVA